MNIFWNILMWYLIGAMVFGLSAAICGIVDLMKSGKDKNEKVQEEVAFERLKGAGWIALLWPVFLYQCGKFTIKGLKSVKSRERG